MLLPLVRSIELARFTPKTSLFTVEVALDWLSTDTCTAQSILKLEPWDVPPPGEGFTIVTFALPATAISAAVIAAVSVVALTYVVAVVLPFHATLEDEINPVPFTVKVKPAPQLLEVDGERELIVGTGLPDWDEDDDPPQLLSPAITGSATSQDRTLTAVLRPFR